MKFFLSLLYFSKMIIALLPFGYPTIVDTDYFGGIDTHIWMWSMHAFPSSNSTPLYSHNFLNSVPISWRGLPYTTFLRFFGTHTTWYLHSHTVCARLFFIFNSFLLDRLLKQPYAILRKEFPFFKYFSLAFAILPSIAGGLALEL